MARFGDNPIKSPLVGTELLAGTDADTNLDICVTPDAIVDYANDHLRLADSSEPGLLSAADFQKLFNLPDFASYSATVARLAHQPMGFFVAVPANGSVTFFCNPLTGLAIAISKIRYKVSAGTLTLAININGTPITAFASLAVTSTLGSATSSPEAILESDDLLSFTISANSGGANLFFSIETVVVPE